MIVPPIKSQGIKTKLVPWILDVIDKSGIDPINSNWVEPFFGTGVVGFNSPLSGKHIVGDTNPHIINFYNKVKEGVISGYTMRQYLEKDQCRRNVRKRISEINRFLAERNASLYLS